VDSHEYMISCSKVLPRRIHVALYGSARADNCTKASSLCITNSTNAVILGISRQMLNSERHESTHITAQHPCYAPPCPLICLVERLLDVPSAIVVTCMLSSVGVAAIAW
jgi:hypothetical protein